VSSAGKSARLAPLVPDIARGIRAAIATLLPFYLARRWGISELAWTALGGWLGTLADPGGLRGTRARVLVVFALAGALLVALTEQAAGTAAATLVLGAIAFGGSLLRALGATAASIGSLLVVVAAIALGGLAQHPGVDALAFLGGAGWAVLLSSIVWPVWTHLPVRLPLATCWCELGAYAAAIDQAVADRLPARDEAWTKIAREHQRKVRAAIEEARAVALVSRARRHRARRRGDLARAPSCRAQSAPRGQRRGRHAPRHARASLRWRGDRARSASCRPAYRRRCGAARS